MGISKQNIIRSKYCVLSLSKSWFAGLWIASGILPLTMWETRMSGLSIVSPVKNEFAASQTVSIKALCEIVSSLSLLNTGTIQSFFKCCKSISIVLASIKWFTFFTFVVSSEITVASSAYWLKLLLLFCAIAGNKIKFSILEFFNSEWLSLFFVFIQILVGGL